MSLQPDFPYPVGAPLPYEFKKLPKATVYYGVWRRTGHIEKFSTESDKFSQTDECATWCRGDTERRAFLNYFHALAYSFKIKERRRTEQLQRA
jgi:hypothetical protein